MSIKYKLLIQALVPLLCATLLGAAAALWITVSEHEKRARRELTENLEQMKNELDHMALGMSQILEAAIQDHQFLSTARSLHLLGEECSGLKQDLQCQMMQQLQRRIQTVGCDVAAFYGTHGLYGHATALQYSITMPDASTGDPVHLAPTADSALVDCSTKRWRASGFLAPIFASIDIPAATAAQFLPMQNELYVQGIAPIKLVSFSDVTFTEQEEPIGSLMLRKRVSAGFVAAFAQRISRDIYLFLPSGELALGSGTLSAAPRAGLVQEAARGDRLVEHEFDGKAYSLLLSPYRYGGETVAILASRMSRDVMVSEMQRIIGLQMAGLVLGLAVATVLALFTGRLITGPIALISREMKEIAQTRDFHRRVTRTSRDEVGELSESFNAMTSQLEEASGAIAAYQEHLEELVEQRTVELRASLHKLEEANNRVLESIHYARTIQQAILPSEAAIASHVPDYFVIWNPKDVIGGDILWFDSHEGGFLFAVVDCTGHGVPGAVMTMIACTTLNRVVHEIGCSDPARILRHLNRLVQSTLSRDNGPTLSDDGLDIGICTVDPSRTSLTFAGARISLYCAREGTAQEIKGNRHSVGYKSSNPNFRFTNHRIALDGSMCFYMATDGIHDQVGGVKHLPLGKKRFMKCLAEHHTRPFTEQRELMLRMFREYKGDDVQRDDVTVVGFRVSAAHPEEGY